jgi:ATP-dependent DNA helicase RecG
MERGCLMKKQDVEWKRAWSDECVACICAFANSDGGELRIGKGGDGRIVGLGYADDAPRAMEERVREELRVPCRASYLGEGYVSVSVDRSPIPVRYRGRVYVRADGFTVERGEGGAGWDPGRSRGSPWDGEPAPGASADDVDEGAVRKFRKKSAGRGRLSPDDLDITDVQLMESLGLLSGGSLSRAAALCFLGEPERWADGAYVAIERVPGGWDPGGAEEIRGPLISQPDLAVEALYNRHLADLIEYDPEEDSYSYPVDPESVREAILNAVVHRDYASGEPVRIVVRADGVEIMSPGSLPAGWDAGRLLSHHPSEPRNPNVSRVFFRSGMTEAWGRGIERIMESCEAGGYLAPRIEASGGGVRVTLPFGRREMDLAAARESVTEIQGMILELMEENPNVTVSEMSYRTMITARRIKINIEKLRKAGLVERVGAKKNGMWIAKK